MKVYFLYQEWQGILVPVYLSQQFTNYNAHQFAKQSYRPELLIDEHRYLNFHDILVKFFIHDHTCTIAIASEHRNKAGRTES